MNKHNVEDAPLSYVQIKELDELIDLNVEIQEAKQKYRKINLEISYKNKELERLSITDPLTQAFNRLKLDEVLSYEIARVKRDQMPLSAVLLDVDKFKSVNDTYGHQVGDSVLVELTQLLLKNIRCTDIFGRWGGEEFLLILPNTSLDNAGVQAEKLRRLIEVSQFKEVGKVTVSFGVSSCLEKGTERSLIEAADQALYEAKKSGRNQVRCQDRAMPVKLQLVQFLDERRAAKN
jgi:diguanylate cyclase (GGDEF)-like protein